MTLTSLADLTAAAERIRGVARRTPLLDVTVEMADRVPERPGRTFHVKCENLQPMGAFKIRGAYNMLARLLDTPPELNLRPVKGVITYSSGNHGQAVAMSARRLGVHAVVVMPTTAPPNKIAGAKELGAEVILEGTTSTERKTRAEALAAERGLVMMPPFDHPWIIEGQGTCGLEILEDLPSAACVLVPVGGGGLLAGIAAAVKLTRPGVRVIGVEPAGAAKMGASLAKGEPVTLASTGSIADGLLPVRPGDLTFLHVREWADEVMTVDDRQIAEATLWLHDRARLVVEPSGAATIAAIRSGALDRLIERGGQIAAVLSGGNVTMDRLMEMRTIAAGAS
ncbi:MAG: threonine/serine dehydratase [Acidobacteriota bacterium]|nr:threonine/serine dehydratase [Acidobacteriota bacterium]